MKDEPRNFVWLKDTVGVMLNFLCMKGVDLIGTFIQTFNLSFQTQQNCKKKNVMRFFLMLISFLFKKCCLKFYKHTKKGTKKLWTNYAGKERARYYVIECPESILYGQFMGRKKSKDLYKKYATKNSKKTVIFFQ